MKRTWGVVTALAVFCAWGLPANAAPLSSDGEIVLDLDIPEGGVALVELRDAAGKDVLRSVVADADGAVEVAVGAGNYRVLPRQVAVDGERFVGRSQPLVVRVQPGRSTAVDVDYVRSLGVQDLKVTALDQTAVTVDWEVERGQDTTVWRLEGDDAPTRPGQGTQVSLRDASSFVDSGLEPGGVYTYSIFARPGDGSFGRDDVDPVSITVSTEGAGSATPVFVLSPGARILDAEEFTPYSTGSSLVLELSEGVVTPTPGTILSVPTSAELPGGYLGEVVTISADGRTVELVSAPMASAFDLYRLDVPDISVLPESSNLPTAPPPAPATMSKAAAPSAAAANVPYQCSGGQTVEVEPDLSMSHAGHANITIDKYNVKFFPDVPYQLRYDVGYTTTLSATVDVSSSGEASCGLDLPRFFKNVSYYPVPVALDAEPKAQLSVFGEASVANFGGAVTAGFREQ